MSPLVGEGLDTPPGAGATALSAGQPLAFGAVDVVWIVLGVLLVALVAVVLIAFFVMRPRAVRQLRASAQLLARETHGRSPLVLSAAKCESISLPAKQNLLGVGMLALTEHGVVFAAANPDRTLIIPRVDVIAANQSGGGAKSGVGRIPQLEVSWRSAGGTEATVVFDTADPGAFTAPLRELSN